MKNGEEKQLSSLKYCLHDETYMLLLREINIVQTGSYFLCRQMTLSRINNIIILSVKGILNDE